MNSYLAAGRIPPGWIMIPLCIVLGLVGAGLAANRDLSKRAGFWWGFLAGPSVGVDRP